MKRFISISLITAVALLAAPAISYASALTGTQIQAIVNLLQSFGADSGTIASVQSALSGVPVSPSSSCLTLTYNLYAGESDGQTNGQVSQLQNFFGVTQTGYFGPQTLQAVQNWQASHGVVSSGSPDTTGYGFVGPQTRNAMSCGGTTTTTTTTTPTSSGFSPTQTNNPLTIRFYVQPSFANAFSDSVNFGDNSSSLVGGDNCGPTYHVCSVDHTYASAGTYTATLEDPSGNSLATATVTVTSNNSTQASATIDQSSLTTTSTNPVITGTAQGASAVSLKVTDSTGAIAGYNDGRPGFVGSNGQWSSNLSFIAPGVYKVQVYANSNDEVNGGVVLATGTLTVNAPVVRTTCPQYSLPWCPANGTIVSLGNDANGCSLGSKCITSTVTPSATIDQSSLVQMTGANIVVSGAYSNTNGVIVYVVSPSAGCTDYQCVSGQLGKDGIYRGTGSGTQNSWSASFGTFYFPGTYQVLVYDSNSKALLTTGTLTVNAQQVSCVTPHITMPSPLPGYSIAATVGQPVKQSFSADQSVTWSLPGQYNTASISGNVMTFTPTSNGSYPVTIAATNSCGAVDAEVFTVVASYPLVTTVSAAVNSSSLAAGSATPTITGTATGLSAVEVVVDYNSVPGKIYGNVAYMNGSVSVTNGAWSTAVSPALPGGTYQVGLYNPSNGQFFGWYPMTVNAPVAAACQVTNVYANQVPGYVYSNLYINVLGLKVNPGDTVGIAGAGTWSSLLFTPQPGTEQKDVVVLQANQTVNAAGVSYILGQENNIYPISVNGTSILCDALGGKG